MKIIIDYPPNYEAINDKFHIKGKSIIFAWGDTIYNPSAADLMPELIAHEEVHGGRQGDDIEGWWQRYLDDPKFRLDEEIHAHRAEYQYLVTHHTSNRNMRRGALKHVAQRLAAPLYGRLISVADARKELKRCL